MAKFRKKKSERATYVYLDAYEKEVFTLRPGDAGFNAKGEAVTVTEADIADLYRMDDDVSNAEKRDSYHGLRRFVDQQSTDGLDIHKDDVALADTESDPEWICAAAEDDAERGENFNAAWATLSDKQRQLVIKKALGLTNKAIGDEEGVSETAIRKQMKTIKKIFENFFT